MTHNELATLMNVSQAQIHRCITEKISPTEYQLTQWAREMRNAEMILRKNEEPYCMDCGSNHYYACILTEK